MNFSSSTLPKQKSVFPISAFALKGLPNQNGDNQIEKKCKWLGFINRCRKRLFSRWERMSRFCAKLWYLCIFQRNYTLSGTHSTTCYTVLPNSPSSSLSFRHHRYFPLRYPGLVFRPYLSHRNIRPPFFPLSTPKKNSDQSHSKLFSPFQICVAASKLFSCLSAPHDSELIFHTVLSNRKKVVMRKWKIERKRKQKRERK